MNIRYNHTTRLFRTHLRVINYCCAESDHERGGSSLAISLIPGSQVFLDPFSRPAPGAFLEMGIEIIFVIGLRKNIGADIAAFHDQVAELNTLALGLFHPITHFRYGGDMRDGGADLRGAHLFPST